MSKTTQLAQIAPHQVVLGLKAVAEQTRLRILMLLKAGELNVKDLTQILRQSQPRISRHMKLLVEAGLVERFREGSWVYFYISERTEGGRWVLQLISRVDTNDAELRRDREREETLRREREAAAQNYFSSHAADWDRIRALHVSETAVEAEMLKAVGQGPFKFLLDLGTGTGRMLELMADRYEHGLGIDVSQEMLGHARTKLAALGPGRAQVRHGDLYSLPLTESTADLVVMHQVLHYLSDPVAAIQEAARVLLPGGRLLIVDFAPHTLEFLREAHAHERLGFASSHVAQWLTDAGLQPMPARKLPPPTGSGGDMLTVSIWQARKPDPSSGSRRRAQPSLEEIR